MSNRAGLNIEKCQSAFAFLLEFGSGWVDDNKVQEYIFNHQVEAAWFHIILELDIDLQNPLDGIARRRLRPEVLVQMRDCD